MTINSFPFVLFFAVILLINSIYAAGKKKRYNLLLLIESYVFLLISDVKTAVSVAVLTIVCYAASYGINKYRDSEKAAKIFCIAGVVIAIGQLCVFKYYGFISELIADITGNDYKASVYISILGISFFTFSAVSYLVDTYRNKIENSALELALYLAYFPKFLSGPIARIGDFKKELDKGAEGLNLENIQTGIQLVVWGMFKKMVIADHLAVFVEDVYLAPEAFSSITCVWVMISYSLQIYFDFAGYSDMAIGFSRMLGIELNKNFDLPYISKNITEFWKRWHISLSTWLQDYLYISLGGNRKGKLRTNINLILTMALGGLWHGASLNFLLWGVIHGAALVVHKWWKRLSADKNIRLNGGVSIAITFIYVTITWVFFRAVDTETAVEMLVQAVSFKDGITQIYSWTWIGIVFAVGEAIYSYLKCKGMPRTSVKYPIMKLNSVKNLMIFFILIGITIILAYVGNTAFIYGKF